MLKVARKVCTRECTKVLLFISEANYPCQLMTNQEALKALSSALALHVKDDVHCLDEEGLITEEQFEPVLSASVQVSAKTN